MATETEEYFGQAPLPGVQYPLTVHYCGNCSMPIEFCEFCPSYEKCKAWLEQNLPDVFSQLNTKDGGGGDGEDAEDEKKRQKRGGKGMVRLKKKDDTPKKVVVFLSPRGKKKTTVIMGLKTFDLDLKACSKTLGQKFACGCSVTGPDEIVLQGDIKEDVIDFILDKWPQIDDDSIEDGGERKR
ncbi:density-regulated protein homolog isoform X1 [Hyalella azteca]|uniref:Density-regulated protein n=1 Tax=Hyalella azteca TaxID=294128 RepID=A0A8B7NU57_HYAAZ|nr:density-regulated protein homolog isoform X1 [Hyalella azteca]